MKYDSLRPILKVIFKTLRRVEYYGVENFPEEGPLLVTPNHVGLIDMFMVGYAVKPQVFWMAKAELFKNKLVANFITSLGAYPVDRSKKDMSAAKSTFNLLEEGKMVGIFPEGTRAKKDKPKPKPKGGAVKFAVETGTPIIPVAIWGNTRLFGKMYVKYGKPITYEKKPDGERYSTLEYNEMAQKLVDDIYAMRDIK